MKDLPPLDSWSDEEKNALIPDKTSWEEQQRLRAEVEKLTLSCHLEESKLVALLPLN